MKRIAFLLLLAGAIAACSHSPTAPTELGDVHNCVWEVDSTSGLPYCDYGNIP